MIINFAPIGSGGGSGSGSSVQWQQTVTAGTQIARITIDGTSQNVYAPEGGGGKTVVNFNGISQADRAALYTTLKALYDGGSGDTINKTYAFYKTVNNNQGAPFDYYEFDSANTLVLGTVVTSGNSTAYEQILKIASDGGVSVITNTVGGGDSVSYSQTLSAGTEIGQITIDGSATTIYAPAGGGSGDENYVIVDALSAITSPIDGMIAYVPAHNETFTGYTISNADGNLFGQVYLKHYNPREHNMMVFEQYDEGAILITNGKAAWYFGGDGNFKYFYRNQVALKYDSTNKLFTILYKPGKFEMSIGVSQEYYSETSGTTQVPAQMYIYKYGKWRLYEDGKISYYLNTISESEYDEMYQDIPQMQDGEVQFIVDDYDNGWANYRFETTDSNFSNGSFYGHTYFSKASNGELFDNNDAMSIRVGWSQSYKDWYFAKYSNFVGVQQTLTGGTKIGTITVNGTGTDLYAPAGGGSQGPTVIDLDSLSQAELIDLYNTLSGATSANTINEDYVFLKSFYDSSYARDLGPIKLQYQYYNGSSNIVFGAACEDRNMQAINGFCVRLTSDGTVDAEYTKYEKGLSYLSKKRILRDHWYVYYDATTSGFSYGTDQQLTPMTWGTGTTCSGMWAFEADTINGAIPGPGEDRDSFWFGLRVNTSEGLRCYAYPSISKVDLGTAVSLTDEQGNTQSFGNKVYFDYGDCVLSLYYNGDWRFGGINITFR